MSEKKISPALQTVLDFTKAVNETSPKNENGKNEYYVSRLIMKERYNEPDKKDATVSLRNHQGESVQFTLSGKGNVIKADYFYKPDKDAKTEHTFLGKDINKLANIAKDPGLTGMAAKMDWSKVPQKEEKEVETEMNEDIEIVD